MKNAQMTLAGLACAAVVALMLGLTSTASADIMPVNGTLTMYNPNTGDTMFEWDKNSQYDIIVQPGQTEPQVTVFAHDVEDFNGTTVGTIYEFVVPNFYDPLPLKTIRVIFDGANGGATGDDTPYVLDVIGADSEYGVPAPSVPVIGDIIGRTEVPERVVEDWIMFPNPDFEVIKAYVPIVYELQKITIHTQSIPEPATMALLGLGGAVILGARRRKA